jgi:hypothetical protein
LKCLYFFFKIEKQIEKTLKADSLNVAFSLEHQTSRCKNRIGLF